MKINIKDIPKQWRKLLKIRSKKRGEPGISDALQHDFGARVHWGFTRKMDTFIEFPDEQNYLMFLLKWS